MHVLDKLASTANRYENNFLEKTWPWNWHFTTPCWNHLRERPQHYNQHLSKRQQHRDPKPASPPKDPQHTGPDTDSGWGMGAQEGGKPPVRRCQSSGEQPAGHRCQTVLKLFDVIGKFASKNIQAQKWSGFFSSKYYNFSCETVKSDKMRRWPISSHQEQTSLWWPGALWGGIGLMPHSFFWRKHKNEEDTQLQKETATPFESERTRFPLACVCGRDGGSLDMRSVLVSTGWCVQARKQAWCWEG